jgi:hypothetical protein
MLYPLLVLNHEFVRSKHGFQHCFCQAEICSMAIKCTQGAKLAHKAMIGSVEMAVSFLEALSLLKIKN